jgi:hypothetical protein
MKRVVGTILCILAILRIGSLVMASKPDTITNQVQDWALVAVLLTIGMALSSAKKKPDAVEKKGE